MWWFLDRAGMPISSPKETPMSTKPESFPVKIVLSFSPSIKLVVQGPLTCQMDDIATLGCSVQQGTKTLAVHALVDTSTHLPGPPSLSSEVLVGINLGGSVWHHLQMVALPRWHYIALLPACSGCDPALDTGGKGLGWDAGHLGWSKRKG